MNDKVFNFTLARSPEDVFNYSKRESELNDREIDLLVGQYIHDFNYLPEVVKNKIKEYILNK